MTLSSSPKQQHNWTLFDFISIHSESEEIILGNQIFLIVIKKPNDVSILKDLLAIIIAILSIILKDAQAQITQKCNEYIFKINKKLALF